MFDSFWSSKFYKWTFEGMNGLYSSIKELLLCITLKKSFPKYCLIIQYNLINPD